MRAIRAPRAQPREQRPIFELDRMGGAHVDDLTPIHGGLVMTHCNGDPELEARMRDELGVTVRCIPLAPASRRPVQPPAE
jgi:prolyl-tRNA synthetase